MQQPNINGINTPNTIGRSALEKLKFSSMQGQPIQMDPQECKWLLEELEKGAPTDGRT